MYFMKKIRRPQYGDVLGVQRGFYQHYGVYVSPECVIEYGSTSGDFGGDIQVQEVSLKKFLGSSENFFICVFPEYEPKEMFSGEENNDLTRLLLTIRRTVKGERYHLYTPEETVQRARSKLGENQYNLMLNNCEHFAIWCKTGISESRQVKEVLSFMEKNVKRHLHGK